MPEPVSLDHPNLHLASTRLRRMLRFWALLFGAMGVLTWIALGDTYPLAAAQWLAAAAMLALGTQPAYLVLAAVIWGLSIASLVPGAANLLGPDPLAMLLETGTFETLVLIFIRIVFAVMAMNQFLFYRMLYGTERMTGLDESLPPIPEVIPNKTNSLSRAAGGLALAAILGILIGWAVLQGQPAAYVLHGSALLATYAVGLGLGAAFSPTDHRPFALSGIFFGAIGFLLALSLAPQL